MILFNTLIVLAGCASTGVEETPLSDCECTDFTTEISALEATIVELTDRLANVEENVDDLDARLATVEAKPTEVSGEVIASDYQVDCNSYGGPNGPHENIRGYPLAWYDGSVSPYGCLVANIDVDDPPYDMAVQYVSDGALAAVEYTLENSIHAFGVDSPQSFDFFTNFGNDLRYDFRGFTPFESQAKVTSAGDVYVQMTAIQHDFSGYPTETGSALPVRVVILHDRAYSAPAYPL